MYISYVHICKYLYTPTHKKFPNFFPNCKWTPFSFVITVKPGETKNP